MRPNLAAPRTARVVVAYLGILGATVLAGVGCGDRAVPSMPPESPTLAKTLTLAPTQTANPAIPTATPSALWVQLRADEFDELQPTDWPTGTREDDDAIMTQRATGGKYLWQIQPRRTARLSTTLSMEPVTDFSLAVDVRLMEGPSSTVMGLEYRIDDSGSKYFFGIYRDTLLCLKYVDDLWRPLVALPDPEAIKVGETNRLMVVATASRFEFFVNDQAVAQITDDAISRGRIGLGVEIRRPDVDMVVEWDNLALLVPREAVEVSKAALLHDGADDEALDGLAAKCEAAFGAPLAQGTLAAPVLAISKAADELGGQWQRFDPLPYLGPVEGLAAQSLICVKETIEQVSAYSDGAGGFVVTWESRLVDLPSGEARASRRVAGPPPPQTKTPDGESFLSFPTAGEFQAWIKDAVGDDTLEVGGYVQGVDYAADGRTLAVASFGSTIDLWDVGAGKLVRSYQSQASPMVDVAFSPDGSLVAGVSRGKGATIWEVASGRELWFHADAGTAVAFSPDGSLLAMGGAEGPKIWDARSGQLLHELEGHDGLATDVAFAPDGRSMATSSVDGTVRLWDTATGASTATLTGESDTVVRCVAFSHNGAILAAGNGDHSISMWDVARRLSLPTLKGHRDSVIDLAFSPSDAIIASAGGDGIVKLWSVFTGLEVRSLVGHHDDVQAVAFFPDGLTLATGSTDETVRLWDLSP